MTPLTALAAFAASRHFVVSTAQLRDLGWTPDAIRHLVASERLFRVYRGVYVFGRRSLTADGRRYAAVLAAPTGAVLGLHSAGCYWELLEHEPMRLQVIVPATRSGRGPRGVDVRRSETLSESDVVVREHLRVTSVLRTLSDLSLDGLEDRLLLRAVRQAGRIHRADLQQLADRPRLRRLVRLYAPLLGMTESELEARFVGLCTRYRLPLPTRVGGPAQGALPALTRPRGPALHLGGDRVRAGRGRGRDPHRDRAACAVCGPMTPRTAQLTPR